MEAAESVLSEFDAQIRPRLSWPINNWLSKDTHKFRQRPLTTAAKEARKGERLRMATRLRHAEGIAGMTRAGQIEHESRRYFEATARAGILYQSEEYESGFIESFYPHYAPQKTEKKPTRQAQIQTQWESDRTERQLEKERLSEIAWAAAEAEEEQLAEVEKERQRSWKSSDQLNRERRARLAAERAKERAPWIEKAARAEDARRQAARAQLEENLGMSIAQAQKLFTPGPMLDDGTPDMSQWIYGVHAHIKVWYWKV